MDERLEKALNFSNYMATVYNQKRSFYEKFNQDLLYFYNGAQFTITKELISFCYIMLEKNQDELVLIDDNDTPVEILDLKVFLENITETYFTASNNYINNYNRLKKQRTIQNLINL